MTHATWRIALGIALIAQAAASAARAANSAGIVVARDASPIELFAAREVYRYVYETTGTRLRIRARDTPPRRPAIIVAQRDRAIVRRSDPSLGALEPAEYALTTLDHRPRRRLILAGGDDVGTLYAAYRFAELLGVRFYLHGDVVGSVRVPFELPVIDERWRPRLALRGILPFNNFPDGPDWWSEDDYHAAVTQLPKLRMNFIGLHTYPENRPDAEPTVWIGAPRDVKRSGRVRFAYPASYHSSSRAAWGYLPKPTSAYSAGGAALFERDEFGAPAMQGPTQGVFDRTAAMLRAAFRHARRLGVATAVGTEVPLTIPRSVSARMGESPTDPDAIARAYEGTFRRIERAYPIDYYWLWTPEHWHWSSASPAEIAAALDDVRIALRTAARIDARFRLAVSGWTLGSPQTQMTFHGALPSDVAFGSLVGTLGREAVSPGFAALKTRSTWVLPWLEDDARLWMPQFWGGRMRRNVDEALRYDVDGAIGIHWHTRTIAPTVAQLAEAAWMPAGNPATAEAAFWHDWARQNFGEAVAADAARIFAHLDGRLPLLGPFESLDHLDESYGFVDEFAALRPSLTDPADIDRFDDWHNTLAYARAAAGAIFLSERFLLALREEPPSRDAGVTSQWARDVLLPSYRTLVRRVELAMDFLLASAGTTGDLGTFATWQHFLIPLLLEKPGEQLAALLGAPLPEDAMPRHSYEGTPRLIVPVVRGTAFEGESLRVRVLALANSPPRRTRACWSRLGGRSHCRPLQSLGRGVYVAEIPAQAAHGAGFAYRVEAELQDGTTLHFPRSGPGSMKTVSVYPWTAR